MRSITTRGWGYRGKGSMVAMIVGILALQGCTMVSSHKLTTSNHLSGASATYALPKTLINIRRETATSALVMSTIIIPDPVHVYALDYDKSPFSDDDLTIEIDTTTGFIKSVNATASDKTSDVLESIGKAAARGFGLNFFGETRVESEGQPFNITFDPIDVADLNRAARELSTLSKGQIGGIRCVNCPSKDTPALDGPVDGILVRPARSIRIDLCSSACNESKTVASQWLKSFSGSPLVSIPVDRAFAVTRTTTLTFTNGEVSKIIHDKPSEAAGAAAIPGKVINSIISGLIQAETDKQGVIDASTASMESKAKLIEAQAKLIEAQTALKKLETPGVTPFQGGTGDQIN